jgi:EF hand
VLGAVAALLLVSAGFFWWQGRAALEKGAPLPEIAAPAGDAPLELPSGAAGAHGAALPKAVKRLMSPEEKRFNRFDRNRDGTITRTEMLSTRVKAFQKLDLNHDNLLSFEEWAVKTSQRFEAIDTNHDGIISRAELEAYYKAQDAKRAERAAARAAACAKPAAKGKAAPEEDEDER